MTKAERNEEICRSYRNGATMEEIRRASGLSRARVQQILRAAGLRKTDRPKRLSGDEEFLGINLSESMKNALREEVARGHLSMSVWTREVIYDRLRELGYQVTP